MWFLTIKKKLKKKLNRRSGFTLSETLLTVLIISIVFGSLTGGFAVMKKAYKQVTEKSNAGMMLSIASKRMESDVRTAGNIVVDDNGVVKCFTSYKRNAIISYNHSDDGIKIIVTNDNKNDDKNKCLLSEKECPGGLKLDYVYESFKLSEDKRYITIKLQVKDKDDKVVEEQEYIWRLANSYKKAGEEK